MAAAVAHVVTGSRGVPRRAAAQTSAIVVAEASAAMSGGTAYSRTRLPQRLRGPNALAPVCASASPLAW